ncbi:MAG: hypothetical protein EP332_08540 [Bacteroidetes bacterium]|nr:MAG: hypothetical protein EP332_08540 [Bacteroidota bacterium]
MSDIGTLFSLLKSNLTRFLGIGFLGIGLNLVLFLFAYMMAPDDISPINLVLLGVVFLLLFPILFWVMAYRFGVQLVLRSAYIQFNPQIQMLITGFTREVINYYEGNRSGSRNDKVYRLGAFLSDKMTQVPGFVKRRIVDKLDEVPVTRYINDIKSSEFVPENEAVLSDKLFHRANAFVLGDLFPTKPGFLIWLLPFNLLAFALCFYFLL